MNALLLLLLSVLQGVTELFPVSSLGHTLLVPGLFGVHLDKHMPALLPFLVSLHLGTAMALLWYFRVRWIAVAQGFFGTLRGRSSDDGHLAWGLIVGTLPAALVGLLLEKPLEHLFHDLRIVALALLVNGIVLWLGGCQREDEALQAGPQRLTLMQAALVGVAQIGALIPGFSRSGLTMIAGSRVGLSRKDAAEFSFLLGTPIILAAGVLELPKLLHDHAQLATAALGGLLTFIAAYLSVRFLMRYFEGHGRLASFGIYCIVAGALCLGWFALHPVQA